MSALDTAAIVVAWVALLVVVGRGRIRDVLNDLHAGPVTKREPCGCDGSGVRLIEGSCDTAPVEVPCSCQSGSIVRERLRSGAAWCEAMACQLDELRGLPEVEPRRRIA